MKKCIKILVKRGSQKKPKKHNKENENLVNGRKKNMEKCNFKKLNNMNYEQGVKYLTECGYVEIWTCETDSTDNNMCEKIFNKYYTLFNTHGKEIDTVSYSEYFSIIDNEKNKPIYATIIERWEK